ncbi:thiamine pyrophosphate-dependent dehydrogenase E1 component subunit alpha [Bdellovibrionales bacterium]|nr:thiamine pyrophosphate-dependent dehydrogenase E1 component subunit alpha [Bdellovibrionales bacterium]
MLDTIPVKLNLGELADPNKFHSPVKVSADKVGLRVEQLKTMWLIRKAEEKLADMVVSKKIVCPCHLGIGQEAIAAGVTEHLRSSDRVFGTHRSHSQFISIGGTVESLFCEVLGKVTGCSRGFGGSMHLYDEKNGFKGSVPIVAATVSMGVGAALAAAMDKATNRDVGVSFFGDGAVEEGSVHESMNFAALNKLPMLFVVENNLYSSHMYINQRQVYDSVSRYATVNGLNVEVVDGNDIEAVSKASKSLLKKARNGEGAGFLEAVTYRWRGHVGPSEDIDVGVKRKGDLNLWKKRDPVRRLKEGLIMTGEFMEEDFQKIQNEVDEMIEASWLRAEESPYPEKSTLFDYVWSNREER